MIADRVSELAVERVGAELDVWLLPPLAYTKSNEHAWSPGTLWYSADTMMSILRDLGDDEIPARPISAGFPPGANPEDIPTLTGAQDALLTAVDWDSLHD